MALPEIQKNPSSRFPFFHKMLSNSDRQLLSSIVSYLHSIKGDATNDSLVEEALRLIQ